MTGARMTFIMISGFYPEPNPDDSLQYKRTVSQELENAVLTVMSWSSQRDVPEGVTDLTRDQAMAVMAILGDPIKDDLMYCIGLYR